jgi:hypothetical protein
VTGGEGEGAFLEALTDSSLYSIGAHFTDRTPDLVDDVLAESVEIEEVGLAAWAAREDVTIEVAFQTLVTALAVRYFKAVAGSG